VALAGLVSLAFAVGGCGGSGGGSGSSSTSASAGGKQGSSNAKPGLALEKLGSFDEPDYLTQPTSGDDSLFVLERRGVVLRLAPDGSKSTFLDIHKDVSLDGEGATSSIAFPPDYAKSGLVYVTYAGRDHRFHLDEFHVDADGMKVDASSRRSVLSYEHPEDIHWGGLAVFGPGGHLYVGTGDGGPDSSPPPAVAQDRDSLLGKLLRIDPEDPPAGQDYAVPADNPFAKGGGTPEVYSYGLRNPWRYSFDAKTDDLWIGDVGDYTQEEIDHTSLEQAAGANFGWPILEGTSKKSGDPVPSGLTPPVVTYKRTGAPDDPVCAVTGGYVVRDASVPSLDGRYIYSDYCAGKIMSVAITGEHPKPEDTGLHVKRLASFAEDADGHVYAVSLGGDVDRIVEN
jgi:glucose/arabinose dehydrogenase